uniref:Mediator of RNA polymerase II transcription subunit 29 n=2 Tax=Ciona savignyi TaxID=51511 RepID=H2YSJ0_CIOSA
MSYRPSSNTAGNPQNIMPMRHPQPGQIVGTTVNKMPATGANTQNIRLRATGPGTFPQRAAAPNPQQVAAANAQNKDPVQKAKALLPHLKESLVNLMAVASQNFAVSVAVDDMQKSVDTSSVPRFDKCLEHFFSLCDQLEVQLNLGHHQLSQALVSTQNTPFMRNVVLKENPNGAQLYGSYVNTVESQLHCVKEIHDLLSNCCKKLQEHQTTHPV